MCHYSLLLEGDGNAGSNGSKFAEESTDLGVYVDWPFWGTCRVLNSVFSGKSLWEISCGDPEQSQPRTSSLWPTQWNPRGRGVQKKELITCARARFSPSLGYSSAVLYIPLPSLDPYWRGGQEEEPPARFSSLGTGCSTTVRACFRGAARVHFYTASDGLVLQVHGEAEKAVVSLVLSLHSFPSQTLITRKRKREREWVHSSGNGWSALRGI